MSSSIFSFDHLRGYCGLPKPEKVRHVATLAALALTLLGGCGVLRWLYEPRNTYRTQATAALSSQTEVLFVGTSHAVFGVRPDRYTQPVMSLASGGLDYACIEALIQANLRRVPNLKVAVIEMDVIPLHRDAVAAYGMDVRPLLELGLGATSIPVKNPVQRLEVAASCVFYPIFTLKRVAPQDLLQARESRTRPAYEADETFPGFLSQHRELGPDYDPGSRFQHILEGNTGDVQRNLRALERSIDLLRSRDVTVLLVRYPLSRHYWKALPEVLRQQFELLDGKMRARSEHDAQVILLDLGKSAEFDDHDFQDADHLNSLGADQLAKILDPKLRELSGGAVSGNLPHYRSAPARVADSQFSGVRAAGRVASAKAEQP